MGSYVKFYWLVQIEGHSPIFFETSAGKSIAPLIGLYVVGVAVMMVRWHTLQYEDLFASLMDFAGWARYLWNHWVVGAREKKTQELGSTDNSMSLYVVEPFARAKCGCHTWPNAVGEIRVRRHGHATAALYCII